MDNSEPIKAFISYSWSSPEHMAWVMDLATRLRHDGIDAHLDKWDLRPGGDALAYMESMVSDPAISKVIIVCDKSYVNKADERSGGVGTETQIITPDIYGKKSQEKYAAIITQTNDDGSPVVPVYYKGRIHLDFTDSGRFEESYEELLRWLLDNPSNVKPALGSVPEHIREPAPASVGTISSFRRAEAAIKGQLATAKGLLRDFQETAVKELKGLRPTAVPGEARDDAVVRSAEQMRPIIAQILSLVTVWTRYGDRTVGIESFTAMLENIGQLTYPDDSVMSWSPMDYDSYKIISYELMIGTLAVLLAEGAYTAAGQFVNHAFYIVDRTSSGPSTRTVASFSSYNDTWEFRKQRLGINRVSLSADSMKDNYSGNPSFDDIMQADFILFLLDEISDRSNIYRRWYPDTLVFASNRFRPFEIFARSESQSFYNQWGPIVLGVDIPTLQAKITEISTNRASRMFDHWGLPVSRLANSENLGIRS